MTNPRFFTTTRWLPLLLLLLLPCPTVALENNLFYACWNLTLPEEDSMYCTGEINMPITEDLYTIRLEKDDQAKEMYRALL